MSRKFTCRECSQDLQIDELKEDHAAERDRLRDEVEVWRMRTIACGVTAQCNTKEAAKAHRIDRTSQYWCAAVGDVADAVDREMELRAMAEAAEKACAALRAELRKTQDELMNARDDYMTARLERDKLRVDLQRLLEVCDVHGNNVKLRDDRDRLRTVLEAAKVAYAEDVDRYAAALRAERQRCAEIVREWWPYKGPGVDNVVRRILEGK